MTGSNKDSFWWKDIDSVGRNPQSVKNWFEDNISIRFGDGSLILFWNYRWLGSVALKELFSLFFQACALQEASIADFGFWVDGK